MAPKKKKRKQPSKDKEPSGPNVTQPQLPATRQAPSNGFREGFLNQSAYRKGSTNTKKSNNVPQSLDTDSDVPSLISDSSDNDSESSDSAYPPLAQEYAKTNINKKQQQVTQIYTCISLLSH